MGVNLRRIKAYRVYNDLGQKDIAKVLGISLTSYCSKEQGHVDFTATEVTKMADKFKVHPGDLFESCSRLFCKHCSKY